MFFLSVFLCNFGRRIFEIEGDNIQDCVCISLTQKRVSGSEKFLLMAKKDLEKIRGERRYIRLCCNDLKEIAVVPSFL